MALHTMCLSEQLRSASGPLLVAYATVCYVLLSSGASPINSNMYGEISPCCDFSMDAGDSLWLNCTVTTESVFAGGHVTLTFRRGQAETEVEQQYLHHHGRSSLILNYTIQRHDRYTTYTCKAGSTVIGPPVTVRLPMRAVAPDNLTCVVEERQTSMTCWWNHADLYGASSYMNLTVTWHTQLKAGDVTPGATYVTPCPELTPTSCRWPSPAVFHPQGVLYHVTLTARLQGRAETDTATFVIDPQDHVVCDGVHDFSVLAVNSTCVVLTWNASAQTSLSGAHNKTFQLALWQQDLPSLVKTRHLGGRGGHVECGLLPATRYTARLSCRVSPALPWGDPATLHFATDLAYPEPPTSCAGCFYQSSGGGYVVFWQPPQADLAYWPLTGYLVQVFDTTNGSLSLLEVDRDATSAAASLDDLHNYTVSIRSGNRKGISRTFAMVLIPAKSLRPPAIRDLHAEMTSSGDVTVTWRIPVPPPAFPGVNVTLVWCPAPPLTCTCRGPALWRDVGDVRAGSVMLSDPHALDLDTTLVGLTVVGSWGQGQVKVGSGVSWVKCHRPPPPTGPHTSIYDYWYCLLIAIVAVVMVLVAVAIYRQTRCRRPSPRRRDSGMALRDYQLINGHNAAPLRYSESDIRQVLDGAEEAAIV